MNARRTIGIALLGVGVATMAVSILGVTFEWGKKTTVSAMKSTTTTLKGKPAVEALGKFTEKWQRAFQSGDVEFLVARLHPAVIERYGEAACRVSINRQAPDPVWKLTVEKVSELGLYEYRSDGHSTMINSAYTVTAFRTSSNQTQGQSGPAAGGTSDIHLALVEGKLRWFSDCGDPLVSN